MLLTDKKFSHVLVCSSIFLLFKKWIKENEIKCTSTFEMLTMALDKSPVSRTQVQLWYNRFKEGREDVNDDARPGWPSRLTTDENIEAVKKIILDNHRITIREVDDDFRSAHVKQFLRMF